MSANCGRLGADYAQFTAIHYSWSPGSISEDNLISYQGDMVAQRCLFCVGFACSPLLLLCLLQIAQLKVSYVITLHGALSQFTRG